MHVHELNPKRSVITMIIFVIIIIAGLLTLTNPRLKYALDPDQTISLVINDNDNISPEQLDNMMTGSTENITLIDIRNHYVFARGHIPGATNISAVELLENDNIRWLKNLKKNGTVVIIYGEDQLQANGPWMVLQQIGFDNVKTLLGGYRYYLAINDKVSPVKEYIPEKAAYDYAEVAKAADIEEENNSNKKKTTIVRRKKKGKAVAGGC